MADRDTVTVGEKDMEYRKSLCEGRDIAQDSYDKALLSAAAGALAIGLGFVRPTPNVTPVFKWLLAVALVSLTLTVISVIASFKASRKGFEAQLEAFDHGLDDDVLYHGRPGGRHSIITELYNRAALGLLFLGICALAAFVVINFGR